MTAPSSRDRRAKERALPDGSTTDDAGPQTSDEDQIGERIGRQLTALREKGVASLAGLRWPDVVLYDALPPLQRSGAAGIRNKTAEWLDAYDGSIGFDVRDMTIAAAGEVAFCHFRPGERHDDHRPGSLDVAALDLPGAAASTAAGRSRTSTCRFRSTRRHV